MAKQVKVHLSCVMKISEYNRLKSQLEKLLPSHMVTRKPVITSRADRLGEAEVMLEDAKAIVGELKDEMEQWRDGMQSTNLENSCKYSQVDDCVNNLEEIHSSLENVDFSGMEFPDWTSMY